MSGGIIWLVLLIPADYIRVRLHSDGQVELPGPVDGINVQVAVVEVASGRTGRDGRGEKGQKGLCPEARRV